MTRWCRRAKGWAAAAVGLLLSSLLASGAPANQAYARANVEA